MENTDSNIVTRSQASRQNVLVNSQGEGNQQNGESICSNFIDRLNTENGANVSPSFRSEATVTLTPIAATITVRKSSIPLTSKCPLTDICLDTKGLKEESLLDINTCSRLSPVIDHANFLIQTAAIDASNNVCSDGLLPISHSDQNILTGSSMGGGFAVNSQTQAGWCGGVSPSLPPFGGSNVGLFTSTPAPSHVNKSYPELDLPHEDKLDKLISLMEENSVEIKNLRVDLTSLQSSLTMCENKIDRVESRLNLEVNSVKTKLDESLAQLDTDFQLEIQQKFQQCIDEQIHLYDYVDDRINEKFLELDEQIAPRLITVGRNIDEKIDSCKETLQDSVKTNVSSFLSTAEGRDLLSTLINRNSHSPTNDLCQLVDDSYTQLRGEILETIGQLKFMQCQFIQELQALKECDTFTPTVPTNHDIQLVSKKIDKLAIWVETLQHQLSAKSKVISALDLKSRKANLIFDGIVEEPNEDRSPRRILVSFNSTQAREAVLSRAGAIARAGPQGGRIYINEDIPEDVKRRRADVFKYVNYMSEKGYNIVQKGDSVVLNNTLYVYEDLSSMPKGMTLADSRTIAKKGVIAFQSPHSPLSNLYIAPLKRNGITYQSAEHAFQHAKAVHCKEYVLARAILNEPNPFDAMAIGKRVDITDDWPDCQLNVMSKILQAKLEQVPAFSSALKSSEKHHLVENTRSLFWGAGTPYNSDKIFDRTYPGKNKLGLLLEEIREKF